ncbi:hypothetical protein KAS33_03070 [bacterium]|nr:hypothetical protein [bacterium]
MVAQGLYARNLSMKKQNLHHKASLLGELAGFDVTGFPLAIFPWTKKISSPFWGRGLGLPVPGTSHGQGRGVKRRLNWK